MITILSDHTNQNVGEKLYAYLNKKSILSEFISVADLNVNPCYSCGGCTDKTYGKCIDRDDAVLPQTSVIRILNVDHTSVWPSIIFDRTGHTWFFLSF